MVLDLLTARYFRFIVRNSNEAGYLVALLNAPCLERAFYESRESGRHFQLHPWRNVPIPFYNSHNELHGRLADLCNLAEEIADSTMRETLRDSPELGQVGLSKRIRTAVFDSDVGVEINELAAEVLPAQAKA